MSLDIYTRLDSEGTECGFLSRNYWYVGFQSNRSHKRKKEKSIHKRVLWGRANVEGGKKLKWCSKKPFYFHSTAEAAWGDGLEELISFGWKKKKSRMQKKKAVFNKTWRYDAMVLGTRGVELLIASFPRTGRWFAPSRGLGRVCQRKYQPAITLWNDTIHHLKVS